MPGRSPSQAIDAFLEPLQAAVACVGHGHLTLSPKARQSGGEPCVWMLNRGERPVDMGNGLGLTAKMGFEVLDRGSSRGSERFKVRTTSYLHGLTRLGGSELIAAHWHPQGLSPYVEPHWHIGADALSETGVFLARTHIASARVSLEYVIRMAIEQMGVTPACDDWNDRLERSEANFDRHKSWSRTPDR